MSIQYVNRVYVRHDGRWVTPPTGDKQDPRLRSWNVRAGGAWMAPVAVPGQWFMVNEPGHEVRFTDYYGNREPPWCRVQFVNPRNDPDWRIESFFFGPYQRRSTSEIHTRNGYEDYYWAIEQDLPADNGYGYEAYSIEEKTADNRIQRWSVAVSDVTTLATILVNDFRTVNMSNNGAGWYAPLDTMALIRVKVYWSAQATAWHRTAGSLPPRMDVFAAPLSMGVKIWANENTLVGSHGQYPVATFTEPIADPVWSQYGLTGTPAFRPQYYDSRLNYTYPNRWELSNYPNGVVVLDPPPYPLRNIAIGAKVEDLVYPQPADWAPNYAQLSVGMAGVDFHFALPGHDVPYELR